MTTVTVRLRTTYDLINPADDLTADEIHVLLDVISTGKKSPGTPWADYDPGPGDPKNRESGWRILLLSAEDKLTIRLGTL